MPACPNVSFSMKKCKLLLIIFCSLGFSLTQAQTPVPLKRYFNGVDHLYETGGDEKVRQQYGYKYELDEGYVYETQVAGTVPLYRYANGKDHLYQLDPKKYGGPEKWGYWPEGICCYVFPNDGAGRLPLYRYNNGVDHLYQTDPKRSGGPEAYGYKYECMEGYVLKEKSAPAVNNVPSGTLADLKDGSYEIQLVSSKLVLDADINHLKNNGCTVQLWKSKRCFEGQNWSNQNWFLKNLGNGLYQITMKVSGGKSLDAFGPDIAKNECKIHLWDAVIDAPGQVWKIIDHGKNGYQIILTATGKALDAQAGSMYNNGCRVQLLDKCENCPSQMWRISQPHCID